MEVFWIGFLLGGKSLVWRCVMFLFIYELWMEINKEELILYEFFFWW